MGKYTEALNALKGQRQPKSLAPVATPTTFQRRLGGLDLQPTLTPRVEPVTQAPNLPTPQITPTLPTPTIEEQRMQRDIRATGVSKPEIIASGQNILRRNQEQQIQQRLADVPGASRSPVTIPKFRTDLEARESALSRGVIKSFAPSPVFTGKETDLGLAGQLMEQAIQEGKAEGIKSLGAIEVGGQLLGTAIQYATMAKALKVIPAVAGLSRTGQFATTQAADLLLDNVVQAPFEVIEAINNDRTATEDIKAFAKRNAVDALFNVIVGGAGEIAKRSGALEALGKLLKSNDANVREATETSYKSIQEELGLPKNMTAEQFLKEQEQLATELDIDRYFRQFETGQEVVEQQAKQLTPQVPPRSFAETFETPTQPFVQSEGFVPRVEPTRVMAESRRIVPELEPARLEVPVDDVTRQSIGDAQSFRNKVSREVTKEPKSITGLFEKAKRSLIDDLDPLKQLEKQVKNGVSSAEESLYKTARLAKGAPEKANEIIRTELEPVIKTFENLGGDYKDLGDYALAMHAKDVNAAGLKSGFTDAEIDAVIKDLYTPEIETARQGLLNVSDTLLQELKTGGFVNDVQIAAMKEKWPNYMPLMRHFDDSKVEFSRGISGAFSNVASPIKALKGSERGVIDPIESLIKNTYKTIDSTSKNAVGLQLAKLANLDQTGTFVRRLAEGEGVGRKNVVNVKIDGQNVGFEVEPEIYKVFNNLDKESTNTIVEILSKPASVLRAGATLTPEFAFRNPFRDVFNAYVVSQSGFNPFTDFASGLASTIKKDDMYSQWLKAGGGYGNVISMDRQAHKKALENIVKQPVTKKFVNVVSPNGFLELLRGITDVTESATKLGEFKKALKTGVSVEEAAYRARDLMDFSKAGSAVRPANKMVAFLNANIQGKDKLIRAISENPARVTSKLVTSMAIPSIGIYALNQKYANEEQKRIIADAPDWLRNTFWLAAIPGTNKVARLPKPFDISVAANATERFLDYGIGQNDAAFDGFLRQTIKDQSIPSMISGILPILEAQANYSFFRESPIIPMREQYLQRKDQYDVNTSELAKFLSVPARSLLGEDKNLSSPRAIDYALKSGTGGLGTYALDLSDWLLQETGVVERPVKPQKGITQLPVVKAFTVNENSSGKSLGQLYDIRNDLQNAKNSAKLNKVPFTMGSELKFANSVADKVSDISKRIRMITNDPDLSAEVKKSQIDELTRQRNEISYQFIQQLQQTEKGKELLR